MAEIRMRIPKASALRVWLLYISNINFIYLFTLSNLKSHHLLRITFSINIDLVHNFFPKLYFFEK